MSDDDGILGKAYTNAMREAKASIRNQGKCGLCGDKYAAHRVVDAQMDRIIGGEGWDDVAYDYDVLMEEMVLRWRALMLLYQDDERLSG